MSLPPRQQSEELLATHVKNPALAHHCYMVAQALEAYATKLNEDPELWYQAGLLHDLDWEAFPTEHPFKAVNELLTTYPEALKQAILAHGPQITGKQPETPIERYLFACDELSGLMHAVSILRPNGFADMAVKSVKKKLKDKGFAVNVSREDIQHGAELIDSPLEDHIAFLITVFANQPLAK
jgi:putative nucleotidyltransferase with HDIG domain